MDPDRGGVILCTGRKPSGSSCRDARSVVSIGTPATTVLCGCGGRLVRFRSARLVRAMFSTPGLKTQKLQTGTTALTPSTSASGQTAGIPRCLWPRSICFFMPRPRWISGTPRTARWNLGKTTLVVSTRSVLPSTASSVRSTPTRQTSRRWGRTLPGRTSTP